MTTTLSFGTLAALLLLAVVLASVCLGVVLIRSGRRRVGTEPRCGHCGYILTGCQSNRCSECGLLFIDAGIVKGVRASARVRKRIGLALILIPVGLVLFSVPSLHMYRQAHFAQLRAEAARRMAQLRLRALSSTTQPAETPDSSTPSPVPGP